MRSCMPRISFLLIAIVAFSPVTVSAKPKTEKPAEQTIKTADFIIYGGTSAGVIAAVEAVRLGKTAIVIEPSQHLGGLSSGGLGWTDSGNKAVIGGISREFYERIKDEYDKPETWRWQDPEAYKRYKADDSTIWVFEPHIAEKVFEDYIREYKIPVYRGERLDLENGVTKEGHRIVEIRMESGLRFRGKQFMDTTYEGDLMAKAGVPYTVGREAAAKYGESLNGVQKARTVKHQFESKVSPYVVPNDPSSGLLPGVHGDDPGEDGSADHRVQAYCFRMCLSNHPENRVPFPKPENYDSVRYELLARYLATGWKGVFNKFDVIPNRKTDTNNHGAFSTDNIGMNYDYPDGDYELREQIIQEHTDYQQGLMWFLANDERVPEDIRKQMNQWGLAKDEFLDNNHWPHQLYIREARRMVSDFVMTQPHLQRTKETPDSVGMGSYNMDSHNVQRYVTPDGYARNEGDIQVSPGGPYPVSYRALCPPKSACTNLLVPVCLSSSHMAYGSIRMEPVFMILGHSAAAAANQAIDRGIAVQDVSYDQLSKQLLEEGQVLEYDGPRRAARMEIDPKTLKGIVIDNRQAKTTGEWTSSGASPRYVSLDYIHDGNEAQGEKTVRFEFVVPNQGEYDVRLGYPSNGNRASNVSVTIEHAHGTETVSVNQKKRGTLSDLFVSLGAYEFTEGTPASVTISTANADGYVVADAIWVVPVAKSK